MIQSLLLGLFLIISALTIFKVLAPFLSTASTKEKVLDKELVAKRRERKKDKIDRLN